MSTPGQSSAPGQQPKDQTDSYTSLVFASFSLGDAAMKELMDDVAGRRDTVIVLRGVAPGESLAKGIARVQSMAASRKVMPSIIINPTLFQEFNVNAVPTVVLLNKPDISKNYKVKSKVSGIGSVDWLKRKFSENNKVDQGNYGPTRDISEPDIIEVAKARLASIDWDEKREMQ
jgi:conjugal transfer pilus assembly protein TraW